MEKNMFDKIFKHHSQINYFLLFSYIILNELINKEYKNLIWAVFLVLFLTLFSLKIWHVLSIEKRNSFLIKIGLNLFFMATLMLLLYSLL